MYVLWYFFTLATVWKTYILRYDAVYIGVGYLAREKNKRRILVNTATNLWVP